jgi:RimJ/RimL family protein N-acetyltransferase
MLETERLILRRLEASDLDKWQAFFLSQRGAAIGGGPSKDEGLGWRAFANLLGHWEINGCGLFAVAHARSGEVIGAIGPWYPAGWPEREIAWNIWSAAHEGQGYAAEATLKVRAYVASELGWKTAVSYIAPDNARSIALAKRLACVVDATAPTPRNVSALVFRHPL